MKEQEPDWTSFRKRIAIDKSIQDVYTAWAEPTKLENWLLEKTVCVDDAGKPRKSDALIQQGDRFIWKWHNRAMEENVRKIYVDCITGWTFWLTNLKAWLEHGITLHARGLAPEETENLVNS